MGSRGRPWLMLKELLTISVSRLSSQGGGVGTESDRVLLGLPRSSDLPFETATLPAEELSASEKEEACSVSIILSWASGGLSPWVEDLPFRDGTRSLEQKPQLF